MKPRPADFFTRPERVAALHGACTSWHGTPFRSHSHIKGLGGGVDCEWYVPSCLLESGAIDAREYGAIIVPAYEVNHAEHSSQSLFIDWFRQPAVRRRVRRVDEDEAHLDGDLVFPKVGLCLHHIGIRIGREVHHIARPSGYCAMTIDQLVLEKSRYRLMEAPAT